MQINKKKRVNCLEKRKVGMMSTGKEKFTKLRDGGYITFQNYLSRIFSDTLQYLPNDSYITSKFKPFMRARILFNFRTY